MQVCASWCLLILWLGLFLTQNQAKNCGQKDLTVWDNKKKSEHLSNTILKKQLSPTPQHDYSIDTTAKGCPVFRLHQYTHYIKPGLASAKKKKHPSWMQTTHTPGLQNALLHNEKHTKPEGPIKRREKPDTLQRWAIPSLWLVAYKWIIYVNIYHFPLSVLYI